MSDVKAGEGHEVSSSSGQKHAAIKFVVEIGPLIAFFIAYAKLGIFWATGTIMVATLISLAVSILVFKKISPVPLVTAGIVCIFGGLAFWFNDPRFFYVKPTIINLLFAAVLAAGLFTGRPLIKTLLGDQVHLTDEGWRKLSIRWLVFFVALAGLNEVMWRCFSESTWATFKVFGILPLTMVFAVAQVGLLRRHEQVS
jgi:intracellular septation protein